MPQQNALDNVMRAFEIGRGISTSIAQTRRSRIQELMNQTAGTSLAKGDYGGAAATLLRGGDLQGGMQVQQLGQNQQQITRERLQSAAPVLLQIGESLLALPDDASRAAAVPQHQEMLRRMGYEDFADQLDDDVSAATIQQEMSSLRTFIPPTEPVSVTAGSHLVDPRNPGTPLFSAPFKPDDASVVYGPDGQPIYATGSAATMNMNARADRTMLDEARTGAADAEAVAPLLTRAQEILDSGFETGFGRDITGQGQRAYLAAGNVVNDLSGGRLQLPNREQVEQTVGQLEELDSITKEAGAQALRLFGGSDTERELLVAIQTNPRVDALPQTNRNIIDRKLRAIRVLMDKPVLMSEFQRLHPSGVTPDGTTWDQFWRNHQTEEFGMEVPTTNAQTGAPVAEPQTNVRMRWNPGTDQLEPIQ